MRLVQSIALWTRLEQMVMLMYKRCVSVIGLLVGDGITILVQLGMEQPSAVRIRVDGA